MFYFISSSFFFFHVFQLCHLGLATMCHPEICNQHVLCSINNTNCTGLIIIAVCTAFNIIVAACTGLIINCTFTVNFPTFVWPSSPSALTSTLCTLDLSSTLQIWSPTLPDIDNQLCLPVFNTVWSWHFTCAWSTTLPALAWFTNLSAIEWLRTHSLTLP